MTTYPFNETDGFKAGRDVWFEMRGPKVAQAAMEEFDAQDKASQNKTKE